MFVLHIVISQKGKMVLQHSLEKLTAGELIFLTETHWDTKLSVNNIIIMTLGVKDIFVILL